MTIGKRITFGFTVTVLITVALGAFTFVKLKHEIAATLAGAVAAGRTGVLIGLATAVVAASVLGYFIIRAVGQALAQGASEQAASLEETSSALEEMSSMTKRNAESAQQASALSGDTKSAADRGNAAMGKMTAAINDIQKSATETAKGFAVVAEEVRNLAMRSSEAAKNTASMIEQSVQNSRNGVTIAAEVGSVLQEITGVAAKVNALIGEIAAASNEQSQGIGQVNTAVTQMDRVTQSNAAIAEESASASEELAAQMTWVVNDLMELVGTREHGVPAAGIQPNAARIALAGARDHGGNPPHDSELTAPAPARRAA